ncbi:probable methyltransferase PMT11 isoform X2 [Impatiens glandulifera]|uniref:probable methyltransferase PMT11 isoform X2 n=1 Tax=Impatiens glandulifera TaxID=253017 RepID=UPI001FB0A8DD|nr:probable methyltransferase PMT11 isoform X2 [Impatiens glandulifera]
MANSTFVKIATIFFIFLSLFFVGKLFDDSYNLTDFSPSTHAKSSSSFQSPDSMNPVSYALSLPPSPSLSVIVPPPPPPPPPPPTVRPPPPPLIAERTGIVDENGIMTSDFEVGEFDPGLIESIANETEKQGRQSDEERQSKVRLKKYGVCAESMVDYIPCLDNVEVISSLNNTGNGEIYERHCPGEGKGLNCVVPRPKGYKLKIPWPQSRDEVWYNNVPHSRLVDDKGGQNWISRKKDKFTFPGGGTQFIHGASQYLDTISKMVPEIEFGKRTRVALDIGCGIASFGAFLLSRNVTTLSVAPKDAHENQIQFALERGVPAMLAVLSTQRLPYPSQAFDFIHCSRCRVNWTRDDGILLLEVNRVLRAGGYFIWAAQPVYKHEENLMEQWKEMMNLTSKMCWELVKKEGYIAVWQKPRNNSCYISRDIAVKPVLCDDDDSPDNDWYVPLKACITKLPENGYGGNVSLWPARLHNPPDRLFSIEMDAYTSRKELLKADTKYWNDIASGYVNVFHWKKLKTRNVLDMRAGYGGFAAALHDLGVDCWVMNVVPVSSTNSLPVIYDRGLIGVRHDWCEPFDTYPRTYDIINAAALFSVENKRCDIAKIILEMDRILRPGGYVYIRDKVSIIDDLNGLAKAVGWVSTLFDTGEGPHGSWKLLRCEKRM